MKSMVRYGPPTTCSAI